MFFGLALVIIGIIFLLEKLGIVSGPIWSYVWPSLLILLGSNMVLGKRRWGKGWHWNCCCPPDHEDKK